jgi:uncharacterized protein (TIGR03067 family)
MIRTSLTGALALALCAGAVADVKDDAAKETKAAAGTWEVSSMTIDGKEVPLPKEGRPRLTIHEDGSYTVKTGDKVEEKGLGKVTPGKTPTVVDITASEGPNKGKTMQAIFEVKGDEMRVCWSEPGKERPTDFTAKEGSGRTLTIYKRVKP